jgi:hypothetical protein
MTDLALVLLVPSFMMLGIAVDFAALAAGAGANTSNQLLSGARCVPGSAANEPSLLKTTPKIGCATCQSLKRGQRDERRKNRRGARVCPTGSLRLALSLSSTWRALSGDPRRVRRTNACNMLGRLRLPGCTRRASSPRTTQPSWPHRACSCDLGWRHAGRRNPRGALSCRGRPHPAAAFRRWSPRCWHGEARQCFPAMVALVERVGCSIVGVHWTNLRSDGSSKANLPKDWQKRSLGPIGGGAVRLGTPRAGDARLPADSPRRRQTLARLRFCERDADGGAV